MPVNPFRPGAFSEYTAQALFYPTLGWNVLLGRTLRVRRWWDEIDDHVLMGAFPFTRDVPRLAAAGVRGVVNTCREYAGPLAAYRAAGIRQLHIPTVDFQPPTLPDVVRAVEFMDEHIARGERVYVHCKAGRGRSATVVLCWLMYAKGMSPEEAQSHLLLKRPHVHRSLHRRKVVLDYWNAHLGFAVGSIADPASEMLSEVVEAARDILGRANEARAAAHALLPPSPPVAE